MKIRKKRLLFYLMVAAFSLLISFLPDIYEKVEYYRFFTMVENELTRAVGRRVCISSLSFKPGKGIGIKAGGIIAVDENGGLVARVDEVTLKVDILQALQKKLIVDEAKLSGIQARFYKSKKKEKRKSVEKKINLEIINLLGRVQAEKIEIEDLWVMVCPGPDEVFVEDCYTAVLEKAELSIRGIQMEASFEGELMLPWYEGEIDFEGFSSIKLKVPDVDASLKLGLRVPSLVKREKWLEKRLELPRTQGETELNVTVEKTDGALRASGKVSSDDLKIEVVEKVFNIGKTKVEFAGQLKETEISVEKIVLDLGEKMALNGSAAISLRENESTTAEKGIEITRVTAAVGIEASDLSYVGNLTASENSPLRGKLEATIMATAEKNIARAEVMASGENIVVHNSKLYGTSGANVGNIELSAEMSATTREITIKEFLVEKAKSSVSGAGIISLAELKPVKGRFNVRSPSLDYRDVKPLLSRKKMKSGSRDFFFKRLKSATVTNVSATLLWKKGWKGSKQFAREGVNAKGKIANAFIDLGNAPIKIRSGKIVLNGGNLFFENARANICGTDTTNLRLNIMSLGSSPRMIIRVEEEIGISSLIRLLNSDGVKLGGFLQDVNAEGALMPSVTVEVPLKIKKRDHVIEGKASFNALKMSVNGIAPLMEDMRGEIIFDGRRITATVKNFKVDKDNMNASIIVPDFLNPAASMKIHASRLRPEKIFAKIPPKPPGSESSQKDGDVDILLEINSPGGTFKTLDFKNFKAAFQIGKDRATIKKLDMDFAEGIFRSKKEGLILFDGPKVNLKFQVKHMDPYDLLKVFGIKNEVIRGDLHATASVKFAGTSMEKIISTLTGKAHFKIKNGRIDESNILLNAFDIVNMDFSRWKTRKLGYRRIEGDLKIVNGLMEIKNAVFNGFFMRIVSMGEFDLRRMKIEIDIGLVPLGAVEKVVGKVPLLGEIIRSGSGKSIIGYYVRVKGPINDYKVVQLGPEGVKEQLNSLIEQLMAEENGDSEQTGSSETKP